MHERIGAYLQSGYYSSFVAFYCIFVVLVIVFSSDIPGPLRSFTNISESMSPMITRNSMTIVAKRRNYEPGDVVAFHFITDGNDTIVTHRIVGVRGNMYVTKGDANEAYDKEAINPRLVIGKVILIIPYLGAFISFVKGYYGTAFFIVFPAYVIIGSECIRILSELKKTDTDRDDTTPPQEMDVKK